MEIKRQRIELILKNRKKLYGLSWTQDESLKGNIIIVTGMEETASRYNDFAIFLCKNHFNVYCVDAFGQGENVDLDKSNLGIWPTSGFRKMVTAIDDLVALLRLSMVPIYIFSHSMGSFICQDFIQRYPEHVSKVVLCGTGSKNYAVPFGFLLAKMIVRAKNRDKKAKILNKLMFGSFNKKISNPRTKFDWLSYDNSVVDNYIADPLCGFGPTNGFCYEFLKGLNRLYKDRFLKKINKKLKLFIIAGDEDPVTGYGKSPEKMKKLYNCYGINDVQTKVYSHARHELLNELSPVKEEVYQDILNFFVDEK